MSSAYRLIAKRGSHKGGECESEPYFWGDLAKEHIRYMRNLTFNDINTLAIDPRMPYCLDRTNKYANKWFSSSDGQTVQEFTALISHRNVNNLVQARGACIVYTHFAAGFVDDRGNVDSAFAKNLEYLASMGGWFVPVNQLLDHLATMTPGTDPGYAYRLRLNLRWGADRVMKKWRYDR
jgi:hypothetical protein